VERNNAKLESKTTDQEDQAKDHHRLVHATAIQAFGNTGDFQGTRSTVNHRHTVQQQTGGQRAKHEVLHRGLGRYD